MLRSENANFAHWSADFVEHIRTVHFSLVAVCLALIGVVQFKKPLNLTTAQCQLQEIKSAVDHWNSAEMLETAFNELGLSAIPAGFSAPHQEQSTERSVWKSVSASWIQLKRTASG